MKLLLTSAGLKNKSIANALFSLVGKKLEDITLVYIPTASNVEVGDKSWLIDNLIVLKNLNFKSIEITDISAVSEKIWKSSFERADVLFFEGGNTYHLMKWLNKINLSKNLSKLLENKVYVGVSAGSMITSPDLMLKFSQNIYEEDLLETTELKGLNFVDFYFFPHLNSNWFKKVRQEIIEETCKNSSKSIYVLDDNSALKIINGKVEVISEGKWFFIDKK